MAKRRQQRDRRDLYAALDELYAQLPKLDCQGLCWDSCGPIGMSELERRRIRTRHGVTIPDGNARRDGPSVCPALTMFNRCRVYQDRPFLCRLWGLTAQMRCNYGCVPEGGLLDERTAHLLWAQVWELAGERRMARLLRDNWQNPADAQRAEAQLQALMEWSQAEWEERRRLAESSGTAVYMPGRSAPLSRQPHRQAR